MQPETRSSPAPSPPGVPESVRGFCLDVLTRGDLETKLRPPLQTSGTPLLDAEPGPPVLIDRPRRDPGLRMDTGSDRLPRPGQLREASHRIECLSRFAHHELMAVEYFAWALLRWPELPAPLRRGLLAALADEQRHCRLYLAQLERHGGRFDTDDHSDYFWRQAPAIIASPCGPRAFLAVMGLTLEQANLDFTLTYRDAFAAAGDDASAAVCQLVHDEEIAHVALAHRWLARLDAGASESPDRDDAPADRAATPRVRNDLDHYLECVPFPLGPARAKGRRFEVSARRKAGLSEEMIEHIRLARSPQEHRPPRDPDSR